MTLGEDTHELQPTRTGELLRDPRVLALALVVLGVIALSVDLPVARNCLAKEKLGQEPVVKLPGDVRKGIYICEAFGHGVGVGFILLTVYVVDRSGRRRVPRMIACVLAAGVGANIFKMLLARTRPHAFIRRDLDFSQTTVWDTFGDFLPLGAGGSACQSFPSAHSAVAAGLAIALAWRFPQGRWLFAVFAVLAGIQRIVSGAHYVSDVCWGLAVGMIAAGMILNCQWLGRWFTAIESRGQR